MADKDKEIIKKIEAEAKKQKPTVLSSKRSAFINKRRSGSIDCISPCNVVSNDVGSNYDSVKIINPGTGQFILVSHPEIYDMWGGEIAKFGNKFWMKKIILGSGAWIKEFEIDSNCNVAFIRQIAIPNNSQGVIFGGAGMAAIDNNTLLVGSVNMGVMPFTNAVASVDISGTTAIYTPLFNVGVPSQLQMTISGDIVYIPSSNTTVTSEAGYDPLTGYMTRGVHYDMSGNVLGWANINDYIPYSMFCYNGEVYIGVNHSPGNVERFDLSTYTISYDPLPVGNAGDVGSSPECCDTAIQPSGECYNIGDIGPEGGIIFAVPLGHPQNNGVNQTSYYYEVAKNDIATGGTPNSAFNMTCGPSTFTQQAQVLGSIGLALVDVTNLYVGMSVTGPNIALRPVITSIVYGSGTSGIIQLSPNAITGGPYTPTDPFSITYQTQGASGWNVSGSEWGVHNKPNIITSLDFGTGHKNTDAIDAYPLFPGTPTGGIHPWLDSHDIAATLCKQQPTQSGMDDWFLPSYWEFREMMDQPLIVSQLGLNTLTQNSENYYWTSSHRLPSGIILSDPDKYAWAYNTDTDSLELAYRCHALSVRPIRKFECVPEPGDPCKDNNTPNTCDCVEYNYRERGGYGLIGECGMSSFDGPDGYGGNLVSPNQIHFGSGNPNSQMINNIGSTYFRIGINSSDVTGNLTTFASWQDDSQGYTISIWDKNYKYIGKWKYDTFVMSEHLVSPDYGYGTVWTVHSTSTNTCNGKGYDITFKNPTHLEGDYPAVAWGQPNVFGSRMVYIKIESAATSNHASGCDALMWGNNTMDSFFDWPYVCMSCDTGSNSICLPFSGVYQPIDNNGGIIPVNLGSNSCGGNFSPCMVSGPITNHCWSVCAVRLGGLGWHAVPDPWWGGQPYGPIAMENNPIGTTPPPFSSNPYTDQDFTDFYNFIETNLGIGPLSPGQSFIFETTGYLMQFQVTDPNTGQVYTSTSVDGICFKYRGVHNYVIPLGILNNGFPLPNIIGDIWTSCCVTSGSSSSLTRPVDNDPSSIKINVSEAPSGFNISSKRIEYLSELGKLDDFIEKNNIGPLFTLPNKELLIEELPFIQSNNIFDFASIISSTLSNQQEVIQLKKPEETSPFEINGYYPLYNNINDAIKNSPENSYHIHEFEGIEYYMPNGLEMGVTQFHGNYNSPE